MQYFSIYIQKIKNYVQNLQIYIFKKIKIYVQNLQIYIYSRNINICSKHTNIHIQKI